MRAVLQRVCEASVSVSGELVGKIERGILVLVGAASGDDSRDVAVLADKIATLRFFSDEQGKMNLNVSQAAGAVLIVSQFTLAASLSRGRRPSFGSAAIPAVAEPLVDQLIDQLRERGLQVESGRFGADMRVNLVNDGPVTFVIDIKDGKVLAG